MVFLKISQNSHENICDEVSFLIKLQTLGSCNFIIKETPTKVFSCEFRKIFINTFFTEHPRTTATANVPFARGYSNEILA